MSVESSVAINNFDNALPAWNAPIEPLTESADRVDSCKGIIFSSDSAKNVSLILTGAMIGALISGIIVEKNPSPRDYRLGLIIFVVVNFSIAVSLAAYRVCLVYCRPKKAEVI